MPFSKLRDKYNIYLSVFYNNRNTMVLRGSNLSPKDSELDRKKAICDKIQYLEKEIKSVSEKEFADTRKILYYYEYCKKQNLKLSSDELPVNKPVTNLVIGSFAGAIARTTVAPIDRIKILVQTNYVLGDSKKYTNSVSTFREIWKNNGFRGFWKGNGINCLRVMPHTGIQFTSYSFLQYS